MIKDKKMNELVDEQTQLFIKDGSQKDKIDVLHRIEKRQKELKKEGYDK